MKETFYLFICCCELLKLWLLINIAHNQVQMMENLVNMYKHRK